MTMQMIISYLALTSCGVVYYNMKGGSKVPSLLMKSLSVSILLKAIEQYFPVVLFIML